MRKRPVLLASLAVFLVGAGGATAVFLVGSEQRRDDRAAYRAYERAVLPSLETVVVVASRMDSSIDALRAGSLTPAESLRRANGWADAFATLRADVGALMPPAFLGDIQRSWTTVFDSYARVPGTFGRAARSSGPNRSALLDAAENVVDRAADLFDRAAESMQFHRRRLGLGPTSKLPDPAATRAS